MRVRSFVIIAAAATACGTSEDPQVRRITIVASSLGQDTAVELATARVVPLPANDANGRVDTTADLSLVVGMQVSLGSTRANAPDTPELCPRGVVDALEDLDDDDADCNWTPRDYFAGNTGDDSVTEAAIGRGYLATDGDGVSRYRIHVVDASYLDDSALDLSLTFELERLR